MKKAHESGLFGVSAIRVNIILSIHTVFSDIYIISTDFGFVNIFTVFILLFGGSYTTYANCYNHSRYRYSVLLLSACSSV